MSWMAVKVPKLETLLGSDIFAAHRRHIAAH